MMNTDINAIYTTVACHYSILMSGNVEVRKGNVKDRKRN